MTPRIVSLFADSDSATTAARRLADGGVEPADIEVHRGAAHAANATSVAIDEAVTGGIVGNFAALFSQLMQVKPSEAQAVTYAESVHHEGTLVSVILRVPAEVDRLCELLRECGATRVARLPQAGLNDGADDAGQKHGAETRT